jgi:hypothetical protein
MEDFIFSLADNGYDDLSAIARANDAEVAQLLGLFQTEASARPPRRRRSAERTVPAEPQAGGDVPGQRAACDGPLRLDCGPRRLQGATAEGACAPGAAGELRPAHLTAAQLVDEWEQSQSQVARCRAPVRLPHKVGLGPARRSGSRPSH